MNGSLLLIGDALVAVLLVATIAVSVRLSRKIARLKGDEVAMRATIGELVAATAAAERAVAGLRSTLSEGERTLSERIGVAERQSDELGRMIRAGESVMGGISHIVESTRRVVSAHALGGAAPVAPPPLEGGRALKAALAAAQAVADRSARRLENRVN